jgi:hypothetical protein
MLDAARAEVPRTLQSTADFVRRNIRAVEVLHRDAEIRAELDALLLRIRANPATNLADMKARPSVAFEALIDLLLALPEPLLTHELYDSFLYATTLVSRDDALHFLASCLAALPPGYRVCTALVLSLCSDLSRGGYPRDVLTAKLACAFLRPPPRPHAADDGPLCALVVDLLLLNADALASSPQTPHRSRSISRGASRATAGGHAAAGPAALASSPYLDHWLQLSGQGPSPWLESVQTGQMAPSQRADVAEATPAVGAPVANAEDGVDGAPVVGDIAEVDGEDVSSAIADGAADGNFFGEAAGGIAGGGGGANDAAVGGQTDAQEDGRRLIAEYGQQSYSEDHESSMDVDSDAMRASVDADHVALRLEVLESATQVATALVRHVAAGLTPSDDRGVVGDPGLADALYIVLSMTSLSLGMNKLEREELLRHLHRTPVEGEVDLFLELGDNVRRRWRLDFILDTLHCISTKSHSLAMQVPTLEMLIKQFGEAVQVIAGQLPADQFVALYRELMPEEAGLVAGDADGARLDELLHVDDEESTRHTPLDRNSRFSASAPLLLTGDALPEVNNRMVAIEELMGRISAYLGGASNPLGEDADAEEKISETVKKLAKVVMGARDSLADFYTQYHVPPVDDHIAGGSAPVVVNNSLDLVRRQLRALLEYVRPDSDAAMLSSMRDLVREIHGEFQRAVALVLI